MEIFSCQSKTSNLPCKHLCLIIHCTTLPIAHTHDQHSRVKPHVPYANPPNCSHVFLRVASALACAIGLCIVYRGQEARAPCHNTAWLLFPRSQFIMFGGDSVSILSFAVLLKHKVHHQDGARLLANQPVSGSCNPQPPLAGPCIGQVLRQARTQSIASNIDTDTPTAALTQRLCPSATVLPPNRTDVLCILGVSTMVWSLS